MSKKRNSIYYRDLHNPSLTPTLKYKHKSGFRLIIYDLLDSFKGHIKRLVLYYRGSFIGRLESGWEGNYLDVTDYVNGFDDLLDLIDNKTVRRYFLKIVREFPLHPGTTYGDFLGKDCRVDWNKVSEYEDKFPENKTQYYPRNLSRRETNKLKKQGIL